MLHKELDHTLYGGVILFWQGAVEIRMWCALGINFGGPIDVCTLNWLPYAQMVKL